MKLYKKLFFRTPSCLLILLSVQIQSIQSAKSASTAKPDSGIFAKTDPKNRIPVISTASPLETPTSTTTKKENVEDTGSPFIERLTSESLMILRRINDRLTNMEAAEIQRGRKLETIEYRMTKIEIVLQERATMLEKIENHIGRKVENLDWEMNKISTLLEVIREEMEKLEKNQVDLKVEITKLDLNQLYNKLTHISTSPKDPVDVSLGLGDHVAKQQIILTTLYNLRRMTDSLQQRVNLMHQNLTDVSNITRAIAQQQKNQLSKEYFYGTMRDFFPESRQAAFTLNIPSASCGDTPEEKLPNDCSEHFHNGFKKNGIYKIQPKGSKQHFFVYCDMKTDGGGWTMIQRRMDGSINFLREWRDYKYGFGNLATEHWLGNEKLYWITNQDVFMLRIELEDFEKRDAYATFQSFAIGSDVEGYMLKLLGRYEGTAGDSFTYHTGMKFSTPDMDNDPWEGGNCAEMHTGGWWYNGCDTSNLNGQYLEGEVGSDQENQGIYWYEWHGPSYSLKRAEMKIRPANFNAKGKNNSPLISS